MLQAIMVAPGKIKFNNVPKPKPSNNEVLIKIKKIGICGSDIHVFHGVHPYTKYPVIQGHEISGIVVEIGCQVKRFSLGEKVTIMPQITCGKCYSCRHEMYHICDSLKVMGFQADGAAQEYFCVPESNVILLPNSMSFKAGAMIEPVSVAVHALSRVGDVDGKRILILGAGTIGNLVGQVAMSLNATAVMNSDLSDFRLNIAKKCGIDFIVNPAKENLNKAILKNFGPDRADIIFECVGIESTITQAISYARKGSTIVIVGVFSKKTLIDLALVQDHELNLIGSLMYQKKDYEKAIKLVYSNKLFPEKLITDNFPFLSYLDAYHHIEKAKDRTMKVMISMD